MSGKINGVNFEQIWKLAEENLKKQNVNNGNITTAQIIAEIERLSQKQNAVESLENGIKVDGLYVEHTGAAQGVPKTGAAGSIPQTMQDCVNNIAQFCATINQYPQEYRVELIQALDNYLAELANSEAPIERLNQLNLPDEIKNTILEKYSNLVNSGNINNPEEVQKLKQEVFALVITNPDANVKDAVLRILDDLIEISQTQTSDAINANMILKYIYKFSQRLDERNIPDQLKKDILQELRTQLQPDKIGNTENNNAIINSIRQKLDSAERIPADEKNQILADLENMLNSTTLNILNPKDWGSPEYFKLQWFRNQVESMLPNVNLLTPEWKNTLTGTISDALQKIKISTPVNDRPVSAELGRASYQTVDNNTNQVVIYSAENAGDGKYRISKHDLNGRAMFVSDKTYTVEELRNEYPRFF